MIYFFETTTIMMMIMIIIHFIYKWLFNALKDTAQRLKHYILWYNDILYNLHKSFKQELWGPLVATGVLTHLFSLNLEETAVLVSVCLINQMIN